MNQHLKRWIVVAFVALVLAQSAVGVVAAAPPTSTSTSATHTLEDDRWYGHEPDHNPDHNETNESEDTGPSRADIVRVTPMQYNEGFVTTTVAESDAVYNTTGPFATFELSEPVEGVRIQQPNARAAMFGSGYAVRVDYTDQAAPRDSTSLYTLELFFEDGSTKTVELYATNTAVSVDTTIDPEYATFIQYVERNAESEGFESTPEGALEYVKLKEDRAEWLEHLWTETLDAYIGLKIASSMNAFKWAEILAILFVASVFLSWKHGWMLRYLQRAESTAEIMREKVRQDALDRRSTAAKHALRDVESFGVNAHAYWSKIGVTTVEDMIELACKGVVKIDEHGNPVEDQHGNDVLAHHGVDDLMQVDPVTERALREQTWLQPVILEGRLPATTALSNIESALLVAETEYGRVEVAETRRKVEELVKKLTGERDYATAETSTEGVRMHRRHDTPGSGTGAD